MADKVQQLSDFIVTKAISQNLTITQVVNVDDATIIAAIPQQYRRGVSKVVLHKAKRSAIHKYVNQKVQALVNDTAFEGSIAAHIPELNITEEMLRGVIIKKIKELRA